MLRDPQDGVPKSGRSFVAQLMQPQGLQAYVACQQPCLGLVSPLFVQVNRIKNKRRISEKNGRIERNPPLRWRTGRCSLGGYLGLEGFLDGYLLLFFANLAFCAISSVPSWFRLPDN